MNKMLLIGLGLYLGYEYLKTHNPTLLSQFGLGNLPYPGLGRVYLSGMGSIGEGYNINEQVGGDASKYEKAHKFYM